MTNRWGVVALAATVGSLVASVPAHGAAAHRWRAEAANVANHGVYRQHEFVYQDYVYDDRGANTDGIDHLDLPFGTAFADPRNPLDLRLSPAPTLRNAGDYMYPVSANHYENVADLIELRVAASKKYVFYRLTYGDMPAADSAVAGICVDEDRVAGTGIQAWPLNAGLTERLGCDHLYTVHGNDGTVTDAAGRTVGIGSVGGSVSADVKQGTVDVRIPRSVADPGRKLWRLTVASGVWDRAAKTWTTVPPIPTPPTGLPFMTGGRPGVPNIWDLLSNNGEPNSTLNEEKQANDLTAQRLLDDHVDVDFRRMASKRNDPDPRLTGVVERLYRSAHPTRVGHGIDISIGLGVTSVYQGPWQPYAAVIPHSYYDHPRKKYPFDLCLHPLGGNHNVEIYFAEAFARADYNPLLTDVLVGTGGMGFRQVEALVDRLDGVYACTLGRGEGVGYEGGDGLVDALEVPADMERRYRVDPDRRTVHGVSLGAIGTWYVSRLYPDRYAAAMPYIFSSGTTGGFDADPLLKNLYNLPAVFAIGTLDEFGQGLQGDPMADKLQADGTEYLYVHYLLRQHEGRIENDFQPFVEAFAYNRRRDRDPPRVRFVFEPSKYSPKLPGKGGAYWASRMKLRNATANGGAAEIDVTSLARADELPRDQTIFDGIYTNAEKGYNARIRGLLRVSTEEFARTWHPDVLEHGWKQLSLTTRPTHTNYPPVSNRFELNGRNLRSVSLSARRMKLSARTAVTGSVDTDGPFTLTLTGPFGKRTRVTVDGARTPARGTGRAITFDIPSGKHAVVIQPPR